MQKAYDGSRGIFQPLNITVVGQVKCSKCYNFYSFSQIDEHLKSHINPKYLIPSTSHHKLQKMKVVGIQNQLTQDTDSNIEISQMRGNQFPNIQKNRKQIQNILLVQNDVKLNTINQNKPFPSIDKRQIVQNIEQNIFIINQPQILYIEKEIQIPQKQEKVNKRNINVYLSQKQRNYKVDIHNSNKKTSSASIYKQFPQSYYLVKSTINQINEQNQIKMPVTTSLPISFYRSPNKNIKIKTQTKNLQKNIQSPCQTDDVQNQIIAKDYGYEKCQCTNCGGFYCKVCNSTIPPQYRPIKLKNLKQSQIIQFWSGVQRNTNCSQNCQQCEKHQ